MGLQLLPPLDGRDFLGLMQADPGAAVAAQGQQNGQNAAMTSALGLQAPHGIAALANAFGIGPSPLQTFQAQQAVAAQRRALAQQQAVDQARELAIEKPSAENYNRLFLLDPEHQAAIKAGHDAMDADQQRTSLRELGALRGYAATGDVDGFKARLQARIDADKAAGLDASDDENMLAAADRPNGLAAIGSMIDYKLAAVLGGDKWQEAFGPAERARTAATAEQQAATAAATQAEQARHNAAEEGKPLIIPKDSVLVDPNAPVGAPAAAPDGGGAPAPAGNNGSGSPRGLRNNNPLNLRPNPHARWAGQTGTDSGNFAQFATPEAGWAAADKNLIAKPTRHGLNSLAQIIGDPQWGWAPAADHNDPAAYAAHVAAAVGVDPNADISAQIKSDPAFRHRLLGAMASVEVGRPMEYGQATGGQPQAQAQPAAQNGARVLFDNRSPEQDDVALTPDAVDLAAGKYLRDGTLPTFGGGKIGAANKLAIYNRAAAMAKDLGLNADDVVAGTASTKALGSALNRATQMRSTVEGSEQTVLRNMDVAMSLAPKGVGGSVPIFNRWIQAGRTQVAGDPQVTAFDTALHTVADEYAKVMTTATGVGGAPTSDSARQEAYRRLNTALTLPQLQSVMGVMRQEMGNRTASLRDVETGLRTQLRAGGAAPGAATPAPVADAGPNHSGYRPGPKDAGGSLYPVFTLEQRNAAVAAGHKGQYYDTDGNLREVR